MAYVVPSTQVNLLCDVPLDTNFDNSLYFTSLSAQTEYYLSKAKYSYTEFTYVRENTEDKIRIAGNAGNCYDCNYLMFQNSAYNNKWFYAFITRVVYVSNDVFDVYYMIDDLQTYFFDLTLRESFIERQHSTRDNIGDNIQPEPVQTGEYVTNSYVNIYSNYNNLCVIIGITDTSGAVVSGNAYDGVYGGETLKAFPIENEDDVAAINDYLADYIQKPDAITSMYMCPAYAVSPRGVTGETTLTYNRHGYSYDWTEGVSPAGEDLDGYKPVNNKMYTYPYNYYCIDNNNGSSLVLRYEFFDDLAPKAKIYSTITQPVQLKLVPTHYKNTGNLPDGQESLTITGFPLCSWNYDTYAAYIAQNTVTNIASVAKTAVSSNASITSSTLSGVASGGAYGAIAGAVTGGISAGYNLVNTIIDLASTYYTNSIAADPLRGSQSNGNINCAIEKNTFYGARMSVTNNYAKSIDNFFTKFGYAQNVLAIPNLSARSHYTYIKTRGANIWGQCPASALRNIKMIFDKGITFWKNPSEVGNYSVSNTIS